MDKLFGHKVGMTQVFAANGMAVPVTVIEVQPAYVTQVRTVERDGYEAVQLGFDKTRKISKPQMGHLRKASENLDEPLPPLRHVREVRGAIDGLTLGATVDLSLFAPGDLVDISGISKGKGFQGGVRRHGFRGGPRTHGQSDKTRAPGSIGSGTTPGRVYKGTRMAGHMGAVRATVQALRVVDIDTENNLLLVQGGIPGAKQGLVEIRKTVKTDKLRVRKG